MKLILKIIKYLSLTLFLITIFLVAFITIWYTHCFFPNDQEYLQKKAASVKFSGRHLEEVELDLLQKLPQAKIFSPLIKKDLDFLLDPKWREKNIYIDQNPYHPDKPKNNLKYSTGKIFYYTYQKDCLVLKNNSKISYKLDKNNSSKRFLEFDLVFPDLDPEISNHQGVLEINYYSKDNRSQLLFKKILDKTIKPAQKPNIPIFRYSNPLDAILFYLKHPGRSVLRENTGWETIRVNLPPKVSATLEIKFHSNGQNKDFLFLGSPHIYKTKPKKRNKHLNIIYLIFDCLSKNHLDLYEYQNLFEQKSLKSIQKKLGERKLLTPSLNQYYNRICLFNNMFTAGQVTRPSIVALWTSQIYTKCRQPVFRNLVTNENQAEFYDQNFTTLASELNQNGYFTKQISCNAQGHGVSGVGVDLGFRENYDYTLETSELTENFRRIIEFLQENQNRKFFLYSHINTPHSPKWIPLNYAFSAYLDGNYNINTAKILGNVRYLNDNLARLLMVIRKLRLDENTLIIVTADHSGGRTPYLRDKKISARDQKSWQGESQRVATFSSQTIYSRSGSQHLLNDYMNVPWVMIIPENKKINPGTIDSYISKLDVTPTLLDLTLNQTNDKFSGKSFKNLLTSSKKSKKRKEVFNNFIPLVGRFQRGFILNGRYKYWRNILGLYKYDLKDNKKYLRQAEYLYDLKNDPDEINNLFYDQKSHNLLVKIRELYQNKFIDYPDKNFIQIQPQQKKSRQIYQVKVKAPQGKIIYPKTYGPNLKYTYLDHSKKSIRFQAIVKNKPVYLSFETKPPETPLEIKIYKNHKLLSSKDLYTTPEKINLFKNPICLKNKKDFYLTRNYGRTGLENVNIPKGSIYFSRIPLNYFMEMSQNQKDIKLSPGIKEVLRGWGYIQ